MQASNSLSSCGLPVAELDQAIFLYSFKFLIFRTFRELLVLRRTSTPFFDVDYESVCLICCGALHEVTAVFSIALQRDICQRCPERTVQFFVILLMGPKDVFIFLFQFFQYAEYNSDSHRKKLETECCGDALFPVVVGGR
ncbi:hypothetical protein Y032_0501g2611 [Ancylostoma ceylanicum]|uniref:Uncharacterized protein n=1 Tax=Ancylostoma ceylanicum TaxID=53326 RepID=A0A016WTP7_9BILA|nr:hypothetical protein Y032_0501g2611 [Ancylostoma ceylanicum]